MKRQYDDEILREYFKVSVMDVVNALMTKSELIYSTDYEPDYKPEEFDGGDLGKYVVEMVSSAAIGEHEDVLEQFCRRDSKGFQVCTREIDVLRSSAGDGPDLELQSGKQGRRMYEPVMYDGEADLGDYVVSIMVSSAVIGEHEEPFCRRDSKGFQVSTREIDVLQSSAGDGPDLGLPSGKQGRPARSFWKRTKKYVRQLFCCCCSSS